ncbi:Uncharacterized protein OS=Burkholderia sp. (strain CCGE1003) GN=BC1003_3134 PE=4 SV=1: DUF1415 [Gemmataceae bacterium]|nr:Uncharacterized protein OS=Burkholderia sp. (strain CCGE1003) GN=BC1003_3134 PE=4 SV=1: DUF1415 [Gemmataceae bacterium]VTT98722.1 Uncharacterized protein OS=Burkholderia sp. (strain CCGE1003) GN=BC1003_3134 PE=4 SV=1: DUF1415 [Gemmataceae bacterium]
MDRDAVVEETRRWIANVVVGLNLCPFARKPFEGGLIRYAVTDATDADSLRGDLERELLALVAVPEAEVETAFLIHPAALPDFLDFNDFVVGCDELLADLGLEGVVQLVGFHPQFRFASTRPDDVTNYTNRSPYPMLHLLREDSVSRVNDDPAKVAEIPKRNMATLRRLGLAGVRSLLASRERERPK